MRCTAERVAETGTYLLIKGLSLAHYEQHISEMPVDQLAAPRHILVQSYRRRLNEREDTSALTQLTLPSLPCPLRLFL